MKSQRTMQVKEIFILSDGKVILFGPLTGSTDLIRPGKWKLLVDKVEYAVVDISGEQIMTRRAVKSEYRAISTYTALKKEELDTAHRSIELVSEI